MKQVRKGLSPISPYYNYDGDEITISVERFNLNDKNHLHTAKNLICDAIILHYIENTEKLTKIKVSQDKNQDGLESLLRLIYQQAKFFNIDIDVPEYDEKYVFKDEWASGINNSIRTDTQELKNELKRRGVKNVNEFSYYQTVSEKDIQIRYKGLQIGRWCPIENVLSAENQQLLKHGGNNISKNSFAEWANWIQDQRTNNESPLFTLDSEHYLESSILELIDHGGFNLGEHIVNKVFSKAKVNFQLPALLYGGYPNNTNTTKFIDILGKTKDNRPVVLELKVKVSGRGKYLFSAISQAICYCNYYVQLRKKKDTNFKKLDELYNLNWNRPIVAVVIDNIGKDRVAENGRNYMKMIENHFQNDISFKFVELDGDAWQRREIKT